MIITCPECETKYRYDERRFDGEATKQVKCTSCGLMFEAANPAIEVKTAGTPVDEIRGVAKRDERVVGRPALEPLGGPENREDEGGIDQCDVQPPRRRVAEPHGEGPDQVLVDDEGEPAQQHHVAADPLGPEQRGPLVGQVETGTAGDGLQPGQDGHHEQGQDEAA